MSDFNPARINLAASYLGCSLKQLAARAGMGDSTIYGLARGDMPFLEGAARKLSYATGLPLNFFILPEHVFTEQSLTFRRRPRMLKPERERITGEFTMLANSARKLIGIAGMEHSTDWISAMAPQYTPTAPDIERLAQEARIVCGIPLDSPVNNVMRAFEKQGVPIAPMRVAGANGRGEGVTSPTRPNDATVIGYFSGSRSGDGMRFTIAHEAGHLILQRHRRPDTTKDTEREAHAFASAFLLPEREARSLLSPSMTIHDFLPIKARWGVSIAALITRGHRLGIFDNERNRSLMMQLSARGWRTTEPVEVPEEHPILMRQLMGNAFGTVTSPTTATATREGIEGFLGIPAALADTWCDGITITENDDKPDQSGTPHGGDAQ